MGSDLVPGFLCGEYRVEHKLAEGGMGSVYSATHPVIGKRAAVKVLHKWLCADEDALRRFVDEARAVNKIGHQNIIDVFAFGGLPDGRSYFVMEWLDGGTLNERLARGPLGRLETTEILEQLAGALEAAHEKGVIHRDVKPDNVYLATDRDRWFVKLLDFGVAKLTAETEPSETQRAMGTPAYISPEQAAADPVSPAADVYSLGVMAYELFVGSRPFDGKTVAEILSKHVREPPPPPHERAKDIPPALEDLLLRMLAKDPRARPALASVRAVLGELRRAEALKADDATLLPSRPVLLRRCSRIGDFKNPILAEIAPGVAWVATKGSAPAVGTPVTVRFEVRSYGVRLDLGAIVGGHSGANAEKVLLRYDRISKDRLDLILKSIADSAVPLGSEASAELDSEWVRAEGAPSSRRAEQSVEQKASARRARAEGVVDPHKSTPLWGLPAKILALTAVVALASALSVAAIASRRVEEERQENLTLLTVRTAQLLSESLGQRLARWGEQLAVAVLSGDLELGAFRTVAVCEKGKCRREGEPIAEESLLRAAETAQTRGKRFSLEPFEGGLLISTPLGRKTGVGAIVSQRLLGLERAPGDTVVAVLDPRRRVLFNTKGGEKELIERHGILQQMKAEGGDKSGQGLYLGPDGEETFAAFQSVYGLSVLVLTPTKPSREEMQLLTRDVLLVAALVIGVSLAVSLLLTRTLTRRLRRLAKQAVQIAAGDFTASADVSGRDEVALLADAFSSMSGALMARDENVREAQQKMNEDELSALRAQVSQSLQGDLAKRLERMREVLDSPLAADAPKKDLERRRKELTSLVGATSGALERVMTLFAIASRRVDLRATVEEAVIFARSHFGDRYEIDFEASNAVLFPRLEAQESEIRELVLSLIEAGADVLPPSARITVSLFLREGKLHLSVRYPSLSGVEAAARGALLATKPILVKHGAESSVYSEADWVSLVIAF